MKRVFCLLLPALFGRAVVFAQTDQAGDAIVAAMKVSTATNYSWTATIDQNSQKREIRGKTSVGGYSLLTFVGYVAGSGASTANAGTDSGVNAVFLGDNKSVVESNGNWVKPANDSPPPARADTGNQNAGGSGGTAGKRAGKNRGMGGGMGGGMGTTSQRGRSSSGGAQDSATLTGSTKPPTAINLPHEELAIITANYADVHIENGVVSGKLTESAAGLLLLPPESLQAMPEKPAGNFRFWTKDGSLTKYELKLTADTGPGGASVKGGLSETITVELTDIGTTQVEVPPLAKLKLRG